MDWAIFWTAAGVFVAAAVPVSLYVFDRLRRDGEQSEFAIEGDDWLLERGLTYDALLHRLIDIDYLSLAGTDLSTRSEGTIAQWAPVFQKSSDTWVLIVFRNTLIVGYWSVFSLSDHAMKKLRAGKLFDSQITANHVRKLTEPSPHSLYCAMIARHPDFSSVGGTVFRLLMQSLAEFIERVQNEGCELEGYYANAFSKEGESLCHSLGMLPFIEAEQGGRVFRGEIDGASMRRLARLARRSKHVSPQQGLEPI